MARRPYAQAEIDFSRLTISSPKRAKSGLVSWQGFFPYYAGFPTSFAHDLISSASLPDGAVVLDPWNGSGTTTFAASRLGYEGRGTDLNPVMIMVSRARLLPPSEASSIRPLARDILSKASSAECTARAGDPLLDWFIPSAAHSVRAIEVSLRTLLTDFASKGLERVELGETSGIAATFYVALFSVARDLAAPLRSSNPTWIRRPKTNQEKIDVNQGELFDRFQSKCEEMADALAAETASRSIFEQGQGNVILKVADTTKDRPFRRVADLVITSPPYCTRIDYVASTRIELSVLSPLVAAPADDLSRSMIGSTKIHAAKYRRSASFGPTCNKFLEQLRSHPSKASSGYYYKTHVDYFRKMASSLDNVASSMKKRAAAILVVQDSYYKEIHNDLPSVISEMASFQGLNLVRRTDFHISRTIAEFNRRAKKYREGSEATEAVLCFSKASI